MITTTAAPPAPPEREPESEPGSAMPPPAPPGAPPPPHPAPTGRRPSSGQRRRWAAGPRMSLTVNLFSLMLGTTGLVALALVVYGSWESQRAAEVTAGQVLVEVADKTALEVGALLRPAGLLTEVGVALPDVAQPPPRSAAAIAGFLRAALTELPSLYSAYRGFADGRFHQMISLAVAGEVTRAAHDAPTGTRFIERRIITTPAGPLEQWLFQDAQGHRLGERINAAVAYDPRQRPWYQKAWHRKGAIMTDLYVFSSLGLPGLTVARPFAASEEGNGQDGVFGVDITLGALSVFLAEQTVSPHARLVVLAGDGSVVAAPGLEAVMAEQSRTTGGSLDVLLADELGDPVVGALGAAITQFGGAVTRFEVAGEPYLARAVAVPAGGAQRLFVGVAAPLSDFTTVVERMRRNGLLFSLVVLALSVPVIFLVSRRASLALTTLAREAERIRSLDLDGEITLASPVREIHALAQAMTAMKGALRTFGLYVPKALVRRILAAQGEIALGGERRELTMLFTDIESYTRLAATMKAETLMVRTSAYFEHLTQAVNTSGGMVDKFIGDGALCLWNAPLDDPDHAMNGCLAMLDFHNRLIGFNQELEAQGAPPMRTRMGLHVGDCVVGNLGSSDRMNYSALGSAVNSAARLEPLNKVYGTRMLVSGEVARRVTDRLVLRLIDHRPPKACPQAPTPFYLPLGLAVEAPATLVGPRVTPADQDWVRRWNQALTRVMDATGLAGGGAPGPRTDEAADGWSGGRGVQTPAGPPAAADVLPAFVALAAERPGDRIAGDLVARLRALGPAPLPQGVAWIDWV